MKLAAVLSAFVAVVSAATAPDTSKPPSGNAIFTPELNQQVPVGQEFTISWDPTTEGKVSILLLRGPSTNVVPIATIADSIDNTGAYDWTPATTLENDVTHYGIQIVVEGSGQYQYSSQFGIKNTGNGDSDNGDNGDDSDKPVESAPPTNEKPPVAITTLTTTICASGVPAPTGGVPVPTGSGVPPPPPGTTSWAVVPTPTPSAPPFNNGAGRNAVGLTGAAVALAAVLAL